jgi:hypothetical protein
MKPNCFECICFVRMRQTACPTMEPHMLNDPDSDPAGLTDAGSLSSIDRSAEYADLKSELEMIASNVGIIIETRSAQAKELASKAAAASVDTTREIVRGYPVASIAAATLLGAALAVVLTPSPRSSRVSRIGHSVPEVTRADLTEIAGQMRRSASHAVQGSSLAAMFERIVNSISSSDANTSLAPAVEKAGAWISSLRTLTGGR